MPLTSLFPWSKRQDKLPRLGRLSPVDVEVADPIGDWYYFGRVEMWEKEFQFKPRPNKEISFTCKKCSSVFMLPPDARHCPKCSSFIKATNEASAEPAAKKLYFYRLLTTYREDEKVIVSDQDFVHDADQIPYTKTRRGSSRMFQVIMIAFGALYALTLYLTALFIQAGPSIIYYSQQAATLEWDVGSIAAVFLSGAVMWAWNGKYNHFVSDWEIQPLRINSVKVSTDFYILTNSSKLPVFENVLQLASLAKPEIDSMVEAVRQFEKQEIDRLQTMLSGTRYQLETTEVEAAAQGLDNIESKLLTRKEKVRERLDVMRYMFFIAVTGVVMLIVGLLAAGVM